jgi:MoaA/NifB/PqqE/SkfB family radical SAM enzyme
MQPIQFYKKQPKSHLRGKFCSVPFTDISVDAQGNYTLCRCQHHMNFVIGSDDMISAWQSDLSQQVRDSVIAGTFDYCSWSCPGLSNLVPAPVSIPDHAAPRWISISNDLSCNLKCPSCRENVIIEKNPDILDRQNRIIDDILKINHTVVVDPCNSGEPLVSPSTMRLLKSLATGIMPNIRLNLSTNGTLIYHYRDLLQSLSKRLQGFSISIDAASRSVYEQVRGEHWDDLMQGLGWLQSQAKFGRSARFVVQQKNWKEMPEFVKMCKDFGFHDVHFQKLRDWGHWSDQWWQNNTLTKDQFGDIKQMSKELVNEFGNFVIFDREFLA